MTKLNYLFKIIILASTLLLSGCFTDYLWGSGGGFPFSRSEPAIIKDYRLKKVDEDTIRAFGRTQQTQPQLVMMGDKYWYVMNEQHTEELLEILTVKLPKPFDINYQLSCDNCLKGFQVELLNDGKTFNIEFSLSYFPQNSHELDTLVKLGFTPNSSKKGLYEQYYRTNGMIYKKSPEVKADYTFETAIPVELVSTEVTTIVDGKELLKKIAWTPAALIGDIILMPVYLIILSD